MSPAPTPGQAAELTRTLLTIRHAVENGSIHPITDAGILAILGGATATPSHLAALFGDVPRQVLARAGRAAGIPWETILAAYVAAKGTSLAHNTELEAALVPGWD